MQWIACNCKLFNLFECKILGVWLLLPAIYVDESFSNHLVACKQIFILFLDTYWARQSDSFPFFPPLLIIFCLYWMYHHRHNCHRIMKLFVKWNNGWCCVVIYLAFYMVAKWFYRTIELISIIMHSKFKLRFNISLLYSKRSRAVYYTQTCIYTNINVESPIFGYQSKRIAQQIGLR